MQFITPLELKNKLDQTEDLFLLDIREAYEREVSSIPSHHIPMGEVCNRLDELPADKSVVVICNSGARAEALTNLLESDFKRDKMIILQGGMTAMLEFNNTL
jgi:rhodanese-related sulfurtransferase